MMKSLLLLLLRMRLKWRAVVLLLLFVPELQADNAIIRNRHDIPDPGEASSTSTSSIRRQPKQGTSSWTLELVRSNLDAEDVFGGFRIRTDGADEAEKDTSTQSQSDGKRCSTSDIICRHFKAALEKDIETQTLAPTPFPTPFPTARPVAPTTTPSISLGPSLSPSRSMSPSRSPSRSPSLIPSAAPSSQPTSVPSLTPSSIPSLSPTKICSVLDSTTGVFFSENSGTTENNNNNNTGAVDYFYEVEVTRTATTLDATNQSQVEEEILSSIGILAADTILPGLFTEECAPFQPPPNQPQPQRRRRLTEAIGVSAEPADLVAPGVECVDAEVNTTLNVCYVVRGAATLYFPFETQSIEATLANITGTTTPEEFAVANENNEILRETRAQSRVAIRAAIGNGFYNNAHPAVAAVHYRSTVPPSVTPRSGEGDGGNRIQWWGWLLIVLAILFCNPCIWIVVFLILYRRRQQQRQNQVGIGDDDDESNKYIPNDQPFNDIEDQSENNANDYSTPNIPSNSNYDNDTQNREDLFAGRQGKPNLSQSESESASESESESSDYESDSDSSDDDDDDDDTNDMLDSSDTSDSSSSDDERQGQRR